jgi:hypothetical protein
MIKKYRIDPGEQMLSNNNFALTILAIMLKRCGDEIIHFSQADFDSVAGLTVLEGQDSQGFMLALTTREDAVAAGIPVNPVEKH